MSVRNLEYLFQPKSVAVVGASTRAHSVGNAVLKNLLDGGFEGPVHPVNPKYREVEGVRCYRDVSDLPDPVDLAVVCTPPSTVPGIVDTLGERGTRGIVILTAGLDAAPEQENAGEDGRGDGDGKPSSSHIERALAAAGRHGVRLLGPNCLGLIVPPLGLNASFAPGMIPPGKLAFVSQSGALATAVADWASSRNIGFSHFVSLGNSADVDFGDLLDYLGGDADARAILLYIESVKHARKFMSAARAASRNKPVIVVKAGRGEAGQRAAASHTGALAGSDLVYDAAIRRAGMLRVATTEDLFDAVETLARSQRPRGDRLVIVTNGGGPGVMAVDALGEGGARLAELGAGTLAKLDGLLPPTWSRGNPVDLIGDAPPERYKDALAVLLDSRDADALVFIHAPTAIVPADTIAEALVPQLQHPRLPVATCWMGGDAIRAARERFENADIPCFDSPEDAVRAFSHVAEFQRNQAQLMQTPAEVAEGVDPDTAAARRVIEAALDADREQLTEPEAKTVLRAYGVPVVETRPAADVDRAVEAAGEIGFPVALKILSNDISHKSDVGGVALGIEDEAALRKAAENMLERVGEKRPEAALDGFTVQHMIDRPDAHELIAGASEDPVFGPVVLFGQGGTAVEVIADRAVALPPLNDTLAAELVSRTRIAKLLAGYRDRPAADAGAIRRTLVQVSQLLADLPEVAELDINPLLADENGVIALDARISVQRPRAPGSARLAIAPYPRGLEETVDFDGRRLVLRPIRPEDEPAHARFFARLKPDDIRFRFFGLVREFPHGQLARYAQIDYDREMAFIASLPESGTPSAEKSGAEMSEAGMSEAGMSESKSAGAETLGVVRAVIGPDRRRAEFAIIVRSDLKGHGLGHLLLDKMIRYLRERGVGTVVGQAMADNREMLALARSLGFETESPDGGVVNLVLELGTDAVRDAGGGDVPGSRPG